MKGKNEQSEVAVWSLDNRNTFFNSVQHTTYFFSSLTISVHSVMLYPELMTSGNETFLYTRNGRIK